jgi:hypothetical protein
MQYLVVEIRCTNTIAKIEYHLPMPPDGERTQDVEVLPAETFGGPFGTVPELLFEKKGLIPALNQMFVADRSSI